MDAAHKIEAQPLSRSRLKELGALFTFVVIGGMAAMPCLCVDGAIAARFKLAVFLLVTLRLGWNIYRRTFRFRDYWIYFAIFITFCLWVDANF